jgi:hypothetical protein
MMYNEPDDFLPLFHSVKELNAQYLTPKEVEIIDRILILDILACSGWEVTEVRTNKSKAVRKEFEGLIRARVLYMKAIMDNRDLLL